MSILINGIGMPKNCRECPLETDYGTCGYYSLYVEAGHDSDCEKRRDDCPLIEIPPHGDLIDKQRMAETNEQHYKIFEGDPNADYARRVVLRMLDQAPVVIPAEEE